MSVGPSHPVASASQARGFSGAVPQRQVRACHTERFVEMYQAFRVEIAEAALRAQSFVAPFGRARMTWVKPSFAWMMYRSAWATAPGQERILRVRLRREGFDWALAHSCLSSFVRDVHGPAEEWVRTLRASPVRVQWDPERTLLLEPLPWRTIQVGIGPAAVGAYCDEWIVGIEDVTPLARRVKELAGEGDLPGALRLLAPETEYPVGEQTAFRLGGHRSLGT